MRPNSVSATLTMLTLFSDGKTTNDRLLFGRATDQLNSHIKTNRHIFLTDKTFCFVRWRGDGYGTQTWRVVVAQAGLPGERLTRIPGVFPGAHLLLHAFGKTRAKRALRTIDILSDQHVLHDIPPAYWRHVNVQIARNKPIEPYDEAAFAAMARARLVS
jgi:hypothetical protein